MRRAVWKFVAGFLIALGIIGLFTWQVGWGDILTAVQGTRLGFLAAGMAVAFAGILGMGVAWWLMVKDVTGLGPVHGMEVFLATMFANAITPLGQLGGEPFIAYILSRDSGTPIGETFGAVLAADLLNTVPFFTLSFTGLLVFLLYFPLNGLVELILTVLIALNLAVITGFIVLWWRRGLLLRLLHGVGRLAARLIDTLGLDRYHQLSRVSGDYLQQKGERFYAILEDVLRNRRRVVTALTVSHVANLLGVLGFYLIILSLGFDPPFSALLFLLPASMLASYLPLPGGLGGIELALTLLVASVARVPADIASAAALLFRLPTYWLVMLVGGLLSTRLSVNILANLLDD